MAEHFNTRDVKNKEIYDSYMGILRISPNEINGTDVDDPTPILNTLYDETKGRRTVIILSDSDGNILPVTFQPRAFQTKVLKRDNTSLVNNYPQVDVLNVATIVGKDDGDDTSFTHSTLYVSNTMKCRSTLLLIRPEKEEESEYRKSNLRILSGGEPAPSDKKKIGDGWLLYPTESPNDKHYFNDKNKHLMFNPDDTTPRHEQVNNTLFEWGRTEHEKIKDERVIIGNRLITELNQYNEEIPVYYTRDYILGHYDGHSINTNVQNNQTEANWGISGNNDEGEVNHITKLSWTRIDKLIWDSLAEILTGQERHSQGRYTELGDKELADGIIEKLQLDDSNHTYLSKAPILGTEMARGTITYHAMPFHRYWFYRTRQALRNFIERRKQTYENVYNSYKGAGNGKTLDEFIVSQKLKDQSNFDGLSIGYEIDLLEKFFNNGLLTPCSMASVGFAHSLGKNFLLCNGRKVTFENFPNISLTNEAIYDTGEYVGGFAKFNNTTKTFIQKTPDDGTALYALLESSGENVFVKLPNLFAIFEKTPRFIRGLNWKIMNHDSIVNIFNKDITTKSTYFNEFSSTTSDMEVIDGLKIGNKNFTTTDKPYFHTYDHLIHKETHHHKLFSNGEGGWGGENLKLLNYPYYKGGETSSRFRTTNFLNFDITYSKTDILGNHFVSAGDSNRLSRAERERDSAETRKNESGQGWCGTSWASYCMGEGVNIYNSAKYEKFTPIPNIGLYLFNTSICNNLGDTGSSHRGFHDDCYRFRDAEGTWHTIAEAPITITKNNISSENSETWTTNIKNYDKEKQIRKFFARKLNEAEGFIPISFFGKAGGYTKTTYTRKEACGTSGMKTKWRSYDERYYNIGGYKMASATYDENKSYWRCLTSISYLNPNKLGVGKITEYIDNLQKNDETVDYYDINCVTQLPKDDKFRNYKYGGIPIPVDETCPSPAHMNLLPLIRI